ncbi:MAG: hypothetical protein ABSH53_02945 [Holophaga sp.]|jgi:hypothetical protein
MSLRVLSHRLERIERFRDSKKPVGPWKTYVCQHLKDTPEEAAEIAEFKKAHPKEQLIVVRVFDGRKRAAA